MPISNIQVSARNSKVEINQSKNDSNFLMAIQKKSKNNIKTINEKSNERNISINTFGAMPIISPK